MLSTLARPAALPASPRGYRAEVTWTPLDERWYREMGARSAAGINILPETALQLAVVYRAINVLAHSVASIPLLIYRRLPNDGKERAQDHAQYAMLHDTPNATLTSFRWRHMMVCQKILWGNHYSEIIPGRGGGGELVPLSPKTTRVVDQLSDGRLVYTTRDATVRGYGPERRLISDELLHIRGFSLDGKIGLPLPDVARNAMGLALAAERHGSMFLRRGQTHAGVLSSDLPMDDDVRKKNEEAWQRARGGPEGSGRTPILSGMKFTPITSTNKDAQWLELRVHQIEDLLRYIGVPGVLCGYADKTSTYASAEQFFLSYVTNTVHPETENIAAEITTSVVVGAPEYYAAFVLEGLLKGDIKTRYAAHQLGILSGWKSRNEVRIEESYNRGPAALDEYLEPMNMQVAGEEPAPPSAPPGGRSTPPPDPDAADEPSAERTRAALARIRQRVVWRLVAKEVRAIAGDAGKLGAAKRYAADPAGWHAWLAEFYAEHATAIAGDLCVDVAAAEGYCRAQIDLLAGGVAATFGTDFTAASTTRLVALTEAPCR